MFGALEQIFGAKYKSRDVGKATSKRRSLPAGQQFGPRDSLLNINSAATAQ
jgi:hypothetical protein